MCLVLFTVIIAIESITVCDGPDYSPLGCFHDEFPFNEYLNGMTRPGNRIDSGLIKPILNSSDANVCL